MKNVTLTLDEALARWARVWAAQRGVSLSRALSDLLREKMEGEASYQAAMRRDLARKPVALSGGRRYPSRDEIHGR